MRLDIQAESALLGAVLCDPGGQAGVLDLVCPEDMFRPWHGQVLAAMQRLHGRDELAAADAVYHELQADPDLPRLVALDAVPLAGLMEAAPRPVHAERYAAIVVENAIRRDLLLAGSRLIQAAETGDLDSALRQVEHTGDKVRVCAARWEALPPSAQLTTPSAGGQPRTRRRFHGDSGLAGTRSRAQNPDQHSQAGPASEPGALVAAVSAGALRDLIDDPRQLAAVDGWLQSRHFTPPVHAALFRLLQEMRTAGIPIDPVTVSWEGARRGIVTDPRRLAGGVGLFAVSTSAEVRRLAVLRQVAEAGTGIQADSSNEAQAPGVLLKSVGARLQVIDAQPLPTRTAVTAEQGRPAEPQRAVIAFEAEREASA